MITERPITMSGPSVRAILARLKTQTRRRVRPVNKRMGRLECPHGVIGDHLWVRETHQVVDGAPVYRATFSGADDGPADRGFCWRAPFYMRREHSRLLLEILDVRCERIADISDQDVIAEGMNALSATVARAQLRDLWNKMHPGHSWESNPWVWALTFGLIEKGR